MAGATLIVIDGVSYPVDDVTAVDFNETQSLTEVEQQQGRDNIGAASEINALLLHGEIPNTTQTIAFNQATGDVSTITHKRGNTVIRTDAFTFAEGSITEVRTLNTGESLTIVTNTDTLMTTVTYAAT